MSETSTEVTPARKTTAQPEPSALPEWALLAVRLPIGMMSRLLWRVRYSGLENIPQSGGVIIASNHQTYFDPFWAGVPIKRPIRFLAWNESFDWPVVGRFLGLFGAWPLKLEKSDPTAIRRSLQWLREGGAIYIFPEGGRCLPDGELMRFKNGAVRLALETRTPILPVTIRGGHRVWPRGYRVPRLSKVEIIYHPLQIVTPQQGEDARVCARRETDRLAQTIGSAL
ncbi:MAG: 1-acyl-sn-glycerol-3-phosphate acyltransferase [Blastocatellia bacterium]|jgi:1-acyl-sn-glycerol-3-phosphate acyltransferase|nr:1-acyl-sn-glycerol-3-phosphate acyltransferase [Blastocatellia bacterium]